MPGHFRRNMKGRSDDEDLNAAIDDAADDLADRVVDREDLDAAIADHIHPTEDR